MLLTVVGSGTSVPLPDRASPSLVIRVNGRTIVLDMGPGSLRQMARAGIPHDSIDRILLTHLHPDHSADLVHFLFATNSPDVLPRRGPVVLCGAVGLGRFVQQLQAVYGHWLTLPPEILSIEEYPVGDRFQRDYEEFFVTALPMCHTPHSLGYRVEDGRGRSVVVSGDTAYCGALVTLSERADVAVFESSFPEAHPVEGHMTPAEAGKAAAEAGVGRLVLTHFYPEVLESDIEAQCRTAFDGELILARDLLDVVI